MLEEEKKSIVVQKLGHSCYRHPCRPIVCASSPSSSAPAGCLVQTRTAAPATHWAYTAAARSDLENRASSDSPRGISIRTTIQTTSSNSNTCPTSCRDTVSGNHKAAHKSRRCSTGCTNYGATPPLPPPKTTIHINYLFP